MVRLLLFLAAVLSSSPVAAMEFCQGKVRVTCVVDGDTFWLQGEKIRLMDIDTPEVGGACEAERVMSARSAGRLAELLSGGVIEIERHGQDHFKRTLGVVSVDGRKVGDIMISEGLARPWAGQREAWCP